MTGDGKESDSSGDGTWRAESTSVTLGGSDATGDGGNAGSKTTRANILGETEDGDELMPEAIFREARGGAESDNYYETTMARAGDMAQALRAPTVEMTRDDYCEAETRNSELHCAEGGWRCRRRHHLDSLLLRAPRRSLSSLVNTL